MPCGLWPQRLTDTASAACTVTNAHEAVSNDRIVIINRNDIVMTVYLSSSIILTNILKEKVCIDGWMDLCLLLFNGKTTDWI